MSDSLIRLAGNIILALGLIFAAREYRATPAPDTRPPSPAAFNEQLAAEYATMGDEACIVQALFAQFATSLQYDGTRAEPVATTTREMGERLAQLMQYRFGADAPFTDRYQPFETLVARELRTRLQLTATAQPLTPEKRAAAVAFFAEVGGQ